MDAEKIEDWAAASLSVRSRLASANFRGRSKCLNAVRGPQGLRAEFSLSDSKLRATARKGANAVADDNGKQSAIIRLSCGRSSVGRLRRARDIASVFRPLIL